MKATLLVKGGVTDKREYALEEGKTYLMGRSREAAVIVKDKLASRNHCKVTATGPEEWTVADLGSSNGTYVNRQRITTRILSHGDTVQIGSAMLEFRLLSATTAPTVITPHEAPESAPPRPQAAAAPPLPPVAPTPPPVPPQAAQVPSPQPPQPTPRPRAAAPQPRTPPPAPPQPKAKEGADEDIRGLFEFLDKVGKGGKPSDDEPLPVIEVDDEPPTKLPDEKTPPPNLEKDTDGGPLFSLLDEVASQEPVHKKPDAQPQRPPQAPPADAAAKQGDEGGLLAFLRKKKQQP